MTVKKLLYRAAFAGAFCGVSLCTAPAANAQEATVYGGVMSARDDNYERSYAWGLEYKQAINNNFAASFTWLNEGHVTGHHRDGFGMQLWAHQPLFDRRFDVAFGIGPYHYYDTVAANRGHRYEDDHGWGVLYSVAATWYFESRWYVQLRANHVQSPSSINTTSFMLGLGYQLDKPAVRGPLAGGTSNGMPTGDVLSVMAGLSVVNSLDSQNAMAEAIEYRHGFWSYIDGTVSFINEGHNNLGSRQGVAAQVWLKNDFFDDRFSMGLGYGPYVTWNKYRNNPEAGDTQNVVASLLTMSMAYRFANHWVARVSWNRVITGYDRDSDIFLAGVGYKF